MKQINLILLALLISACTPKQIVKPASTTFSPMGNAKPLSFHQMLRQDLNQFSLTDMLMVDASYFASDSLGGRGVASDGSMLTRAYIKERFEILGLKMFNNSYLKPFEMGNKTATNVIGWMEGSANPDSFIVITAHFDHLGTLNGQIYNGADDNASGSAGLLALALALKQNPPKHSVIFAALDAEEQGLLGAKDFVNNPPVAIKSIKLNLNMDMIGRNKDHALNICGTYLYPQLKPLVTHITTPVSNLKFTFLHDQPTDRGANNWIGASDHGMFHRMDIPFLYFGVEDHEDYHKITDDADKLMPDFYANVVKTIIAITHHLDENL